MRQKLQGEVYRSRLHKGLEIAMSMFGEIPAIDALIVGGNRGIGLGFVQQLLAIKAQFPAVGRLYATYRQTATSQLLELAAQHPDRLTLLPMDITDEAQIAHGVEQIRAQHERLHLVVYSAGVLHEGELQPEKSLQQLQADRLLRYFQVNSIGAVLLAKHVLPLLKHRDRSVFASISAKVGSIGDNEAGGWYGYRASKSALNMFLRTAAIEYGRKSPNTLVVMLHPGTTDTHLSQPFQRNVPPEKLFSVDRTVAQLLTVIDQLQPADSGHFFSWDGTRLPW
jgi:NAD(P)-dependent dehydrogenase (short-subunit alcohol dehydrogenase family)